MFAICWAALDQMSILPKIDNKFIKIFLYSLQGAISNENTLTRHTFSARKNLILGFFAMHLK